jgi:hypothetical protein
MALYPASDGEAIRKEIFTLNFARIGSDEKFMTQLTTGQ